jgi:hypothetical protein
MKSGFYLSPCGGHIVEIIRRQNFFDIDFVIEICIKDNECINIFESQLKVLLCCWTYLGY